MPISTFRIHGLSVLSPSEAERLGFESITTDIHAHHEKPILASVCQHRDSDRAALIQTAEETYQLAIIKTSIIPVEPEE
jgi:hypothetical protein